MKDIKPIKRYDDYTCDEGVDISQFREYSEERIRAIFEKIENDEG
jgi:hypothetical protein